MSHKIKNTNSITYTARLVSHKIKCDEISKTKCQHKILILQSMVKSIPLE